MRKPVTPYCVLQSRRDLRAGFTAAYADKMLHDIPDAPVVDRVKFILERCADKNVLNIGSASGGLHEQIRGVAEMVIGVDKEDGPDTDFHDEVDSVNCGWARGYLEEYGNPQVAVCGEVLEHMENPGLFLNHLRGLKPRETIITVPNALCSIGPHWAVKGVEMVNRDHVAWYSWKTLTTLVTRCGYTVEEFYWYNGKPVFAEGLIFVLGVTDESQEKPA